MSMTIPRTSRYRPSKMPSGVGQLALSEAISAALRLLLCARTAAGKVAAEAMTRIRARADDLGILYYLTLQNVLLGSWSVSSVHPGYHEHRIRPLARGWW